MNRQFSSFMILLILAGIALISVHPLPLHIFDGLPSPEGFPSVIRSSDPAMFCWNLWWTDNWISGRHSLFHTDLLHHPFGISLGRHTLSTANGLIAFPITRLLGAIPAFNILIIFHAMLTACAMYLLSREWGSGRYAALIASLLFTWWPARIVHAGFHLNLASTGWTLLTLWCLIRAVRLHSLRHYAGTVFFLALTGYSSWHLFLQLCLILPLFAVCGSLPEHKKTILFMKLPILLGLGLLILLPAIMQLFPENHDFPAISKDEIVRYSTPPARFFIPAAGHPIFSKSVAPHDRSIPGNIIENTGFLGFTTAIIMLTGLLVGHTRDRWLIVSGCVFAVLALGPTISVGTRQIPLPHTLFDSLPLLNFSRTPGRFLIATGLLWSVACASTLSKPAFQRRPLLILLALLIGIEFLPGRLNIVWPGPMQEYHRLASRSSRGIIEVPNEWSNQYFMLGQTIHHHPISSGFLSRLPQTVFHRISGIPHLAGLSDPALAYDTLRQMTPIDFVRLRDLLSVDTLVFHEKFCAPPPDNSSVHLAHLSPEIIPGSRFSCSSTLLIDLNQFTENLQVPEVFMIDRWSGPEDWKDGLSPVYWGLYPAARMRLLGLKGSARLSFQAFAAHQQENRPVDVDIMLDDRVIGHFSLTEPQKWIPVSVTIDPLTGRQTKTDSAGRAYQDIWLVFSTGSVPAKSADSIYKNAADVRCLAVAVRDVSLASF